MFFYHKVTKDTKVLSQSNQMIHSHAEHGNEKKTILCVLVTSW